MPDYNLLKRIAQSLEKELPAVEGAASREVAPASQAASDLPAVITKDGEVIGQGTSKASPPPSPQDADILSQGGKTGPDPAAITDQSSVDSLSDKWNKYKNPALVAGGAGAAGLTYLMANKDGSPQTSASSPLPDNTQTIPASAFKGTTVIGKGPVESSDDSTPSVPSAPSSKATAKPSDDEDDSFKPKYNLDTRNLGSVDELRRIQNSTNEAQYGNSMARIGAAAAAGMGGNKNYYDQILADRGKEIANRPDQYIQQVAFQKADPNSAVSQTYKQLADYLGMPVHPGSSAADIEKVFPQIADIKSAEDAVEARKEMNENTVAERRERDKDRASEMAYRQQVMLSNAQDKKDAMQQTRFNQTVQQLEQMRGSPAVSQAEKDIYAAQKANSLVNSMGGNPNKLNPQQVQLLVNEVGKIASGGVSSQSELNLLSPNTLQSQFASTWQKLSNSPTPANAGKFVKQYQDYASNLTKDAQNVIKDRYGRIINARSSQFDPDQIKQLQDNYINRFDAQPSRIQPRLPAGQMPIPMTSPQGVQAAPKSQDPKIAKFASDNGLQYNDASKILTARGYNAGQ